MSPLRRNLLVALAAAFGIALAAGITWGTSQLVRQRIGLASEPLTAGSRLLAPSTPAQTVRIPRAPTSTGSQTPSVPSSSTPTRSSTPTQTLAPPSSSEAEPSSSAPGSPAPSKSEKERGEGGSGGEASTGSGGGGDRHSHGDD